MIWRLKFAAGNEGGIPLILLAVGYQPHGTLQMANRPVTIGTINDYMHKRNGQKQDHPQRADPGGPKARVVVICRHGVR